MNRRVTRLIGIPKTVAKKSTGYLATMLFVFSALQPTAFAITENNSRVPQGVKNTVYNTYKQNPGGPKLPPAPANQCNGKNNFQYLWTSLDINSKVDEDLKEQVLDLAEGQNSVKLRLNAVGGYCDSIISRTSNGTGVITDKSLEESRFTVNEKPTVSVDGGSYGGSGVGISGLSVNDLLRVNYKNAIDNNRRWAKQADQYPFHRGFTLTGLGNLAPKTDAYVIKVKIPVKGVNYFPGGYAGNVNNKFICINGATPTNDLSDSSNKCGPSNLYAELQVRINANFSGTCFITKIGSTEIENEDTAPTLAPGESFKANFTVYNGGKSNWDLRGVSNDQVYLQALSGGDEWGAESISLEGRGNLLGGAALQSKTDTGDFSPDITFKVPTDVSAGETRSFSWVVYKNGTDGGAISAACNVNIKIRANQPFLRVSGGDVRAGAWFNGAGLQCGINQLGAATADVKTSGFWASNSNNLNLRSLGGVSSSQYAVLATGLINGGAGSNNFAGGNAIPRETRKDLTFANSGTGDYGYYNGNPNLGAAYCEDVSSLISQKDGVVPGSLGSGYSGQNVYYQTENLELNRNIEYTDTYTDLNDVPNLVVIVKGDIHIQNSVTRLDGTYIALQRDDGTGGIIDTCSDVAKGSWPDAGSGGLSLSGCNSKLTINGRLIARDVLWKRTAGTLGDNNSIISDNCAVGNQPISNPQTFVAALEQCAAEFINMTPEVYFGSDKSGPGSTSNVGNVPVSSIELPPIY